MGIFIHMEEDISSYFWISLHPYPSRNLNFFLLDLMSQQSSFWLKIILIGILVLTIKNMD